MSYFYKGIFNQHSILKSFNIAVTTLRESYPLEAGKFILLPKDGDHNVIMKLPNKGKAEFDSDIVPLKYGLICNQFSDNCKAVEIYRKIHKCKIVVIEGEPLSGKSEVRMGVVTWEYVYLCVF
jgi:hypothetical protein